MQIVVNKDLSIAAVEPSEIYQGSSNADYLSIFAPFSMTSYASILLYFKLPNGEILTPRVAFPNARSATLGFGLWSTPLDADLTKKVGFVKCQLEFVGGIDINDQPIRKRTEEFQFKVNPGIPADLPEAPSYDVYNEILTYLTTIAENGIGGGGGGGEYDDTAILQLIQEETTERIAADSSLRSAIQSEASTRANAVADLQSQLNTARSNAIGLPTYNATTGIMTFTTLDGNSTRTIDLPVESILSSVAFNSNGTEIVFTFRNGDVINIPVSNLTLPVWNTDIIDPLQEELPIPPTTEAVINYVNHVISDLPAPSGGGSVQIQQFEGWGSPTMEGDTAQFIILAQDDPCGGESSGTITITPPLSVSVYLSQYALKIAGDEDIFSTGYNDAYINAYQGKIVVSVAVDMLVTINIDESRKLITIMFTKMKPRYL